jgi:hypothetical protein
MLASSTRPSGPCRRSSGYLDGDERELTNMNQEVSESRPQSQVTNAYIEKAIDVEMKTLARQLYHRDVVEGRRDTSTMSNESSQTGIKG